MDQDTLDFERGAAVVTPDGEAGRLAHVVVDETGGASQIVVDRADGRWLVPIDAIVSSDGSRVRLRGGWYDAEPELFAPHQFDGPADGLVLRARGTPAAVDAPMPPRPAPSEPSLEPTQRMAPVTRTVPADAPASAEPIKPAVARLEETPMPADEPPPRPASVAWAQPVSEPTGAGPTAHVAPPTPAALPAFDPNPAPTTPEPVVVESPPAAFESASTPVEATQPIAPLEAAPMPADEPPPQPAPVAWAQHVVEPDAPPASTPPPMPAPPIATNAPPTPRPVGEGPRSGGEGLLHHSRAGEATPNTSLQPDRLELREEQVIPRVESVRAGVVRVGKEIVTDVKTLEVPIEREYVVVEHRPIEGRRPAAGPVEERVIEVPVHAERVVVEKVPILREEVRVGKRVVPEVANVKATARKERAVVDVQGDAEVQHRPAKRRTRA